MLLLNYWSSGSHPGSLSIVLNRASRSKSDLVIVCSEPSRACMSHSGVYAKVLKFLEGFPSSGSPYSPTPISPYSLYSSLTGFLCALKLWVFLFSVYFTLGIFSLRYFHGFLSHLFQPYHEPLPDYPV